MIATFQRREKKFLLDAAQTAFLLEGIAPYTDADSYSSSPSGYRVCSVYFDTPDSRIIRANLQKPDYREKLRLRSYGPAEEDTNVFLELKKKIRGEGIKRRVILPLKEIRQFLDTRRRPEELSYLNRQVLDEIEYFLSRYPDIAPVLYVGCDRRAFFGKDDPELRITFDRDILTRREAVDLTAGHFGVPLLAPGQQLMEIKLSRAVPLWLARLLSEAKAYSTTFSKYGKEYERSISSRA